MALPLSWKLPSFCSVDTPLMHMPLCRDVYWQIIITDIVSKIITIIAIINH